MPTESRAPREVWRIPHKKLAIVMSPVPQGEKFATGHRAFVRLPFIERTIAPSDAELVLTTGRVGEQVDFPVPFHMKGGPDQSKVHGTFTFKLIGEPHQEKYVHEIHFADIGREGTAVYTLPKGISTVREIFKNMKSATPHGETPHIKTGIVRVRPNETVLVFGVPKGTVEHKHLYVGDYEDASGNKRISFYDEYGNIYPWAVVHADPKKHKKVLEQ